MYSINVAERRVGDTPPRHIFATDSDSISTERLAKEIAEQLVDAFPVGKYEITIFRVETFHREIDWEPMT